MFETGGAQAVCKKQHHTRSGKEKTVIMQLKEFGGSAFKHSEKQTTPVRKCKKDFSVRYNTKPNGYRIWFQKET